jgi:hypothetical protein
MASQYSEDVQNILDAWLVEIYKLVDDGKLSAVLAQNIQSLIASGKIDDITKIRSAIENGVKNVGAD